MQHNDFQLLPQTIALLGLNNSAKSVQVDAKQNHEQKLKQDRQKAAHVKQLKFEAAFEIKDVSCKNFQCKTSECNRMFLTQKRLLFHQLSQTCGLASRIPVASQEAKESKQRATP